MYTLVFKFATLSHEQFVFRRKATNGMDVNLMCSSSQLSASISIKKASIELFKCQNIFLVKIIANHSSTYKSDSTPKTGYRQVKALHILLYLQQYLLK